MKNIIIATIIIWIIATIIICKIVRNKYTEEKRKRFEFVYMKLKTVAILSGIILIISSLTISWHSDFTIIILVFASLILILTTSLMAEIERAYQDKRNSATKFM